MSEATPTTPPWQRPGTLPLPTATTAAPAGGAAASTPPWQQVLGLPFASLNADPQYQRCLDAELCDHPQGGNVHCFDLELVEDHLRGIVGRVVLSAGYNVAPLPYQLTWQDTFAEVQRKLGPASVYDGYGFSYVWDDYGELRPYPLVISFDVTRMADPQLASSLMTQLALGVL